MLSALRDRDYRLLWLGQAVSFLGDQFHLVALPWLVLTLTKDPLQIGLVLACASIPRAVFMLVGGAWADRHSPRLIMLVSDSIRFVVSALLAFAILSGGIEMWMVYTLALVFGTVSGFFHPAANVAIPRILEDENLESGNSLFQIADQGAAFLGPAAAGVLIALFGRELVGSEEIASLTGIGIAFAIDTLTFAVSALCLGLMQPLPAPETGADQHPLQAIKEGFVWLANEPEIRWVLIIIALGNSLISGPLLVGLPVLASERLGQGGAAAFGIILSVFAGGNLVGMVVAGSVPRLSGRGFVAATVGLVGGFGLAMMSLAFVDATWEALPLMALVGVANGYMAVTFISQLQRVTPDAMLGRVMGLFMFSMYGLMPLSQIIAGVVVRQGVVLLFVAAGTSLLAVAALALTRPELRSLSARLDIAEVSES
ncbi:MAG TPA: MFS transporter [Coriobacteriia bacterium]|nr:MFS transporter [Coriobacteriia bacterium]